MARAEPPRTPAAAQRPAVASLTLLPTAVSEGSVLRPARPDDDLRGLAQNLDALLAETAQDLGLAVVPAPPRVTRLGDADLLARAREGRGSVVLPSLRASSTGEVELRLALADPASRALDVRRVRVARADLPVRAVILLRDLVGRREGASRRPGIGAPAPSGPTPIANAGRITLMANSTAFGGLLGYSIQRASGSTDPKLLVSLIGLGAGIGLGASFVASNEWEVGSGDAWWFAAGAWWPTIGGHLIFQGRFSARRPDVDRWVFGLIGGTGGAAIATLGLALHPMSDGSAVIAHSGGGFGLLFGAAVELAVRGDIHQVPFSGMGYGAGLGWLAAAALAAQVSPPPLRVLAVDVGVTLGGLAGAGLASPLLLDHPSAARQRAWVGITAGTAVTGGVVSLFVSRSWFAKPPAESVRRAGLPMIGVLGESAVGSVRAPIWGLGWSGTID